MMKDSFEREKRYQTMIAISRRMLQAEIISKEDYEKLERRYNEKYQPLLRVKMT